MYCLPCQISINFQLFGVCKFSFETTFLTKHFMEVVKFGPTVVVIVFFGSLLPPFPCCIFFEAFLISSVYDLSWSGWWMLLLNAFQHSWWRNFSGLMNKFPFKVNQPCMIQPRSPCYFCQKFEGFAAKSKVKLTRNEFCWFPMFQTCGGLSWFVSLHFYPILRFYRFYSCTEYGIFSCNFLTSL